MTQAEDFMAELIPEWELADTFGKTLRTLRNVIAHPRHELVHYAASTEPPARQVRMAAKALRPRSIPVSITEQTAA